MNNDIKAGILCFCILITLFMSIFGIVAIINYNEISAKNDYLEKQVKEQSLLIDYLKKEEKK